MGKDRGKARGWQSPAGRQRLRAYGLPLLVRLVVFVLAALLLFPLLKAALGGPQDSPARSLQLFLLAVIPLSVLAAAWQDWRHRRLAASPAFEAALNQPATEWLEAGADFGRVKLDGEMPRESVYLPGWRPRWLLVTNRRVLLFVAAGDERRLLSEWPRRAVVFAGPPDGLPHGHRRPAWLRVLLRAPNLVLAFTTGTVLQLHCASTVTARRVAQLLMSSPAIPQESILPSTFGASEGSRR